MRHSALAGHTGCDSGNASTSTLNDLGDNKLRNIAPTVSSVEHESDADQTEAECEDESLLVASLEHNDDTGPNKAENCGTLH